MRWTAALTRLGYDSSNPEPRVAWCSSLIIVVILSSLIGVLSAWRRYRKPLSEARKGAQDWGAERTTALEKANEDPLLTRGLRVTKLLSRRCARDEFTKPFASPQVREDNPPARYDFQLQIQPG